MDDFLSKMYEEEMTKTAGSELDEFMQTLSKEELEGFLFEKEAVAGPKDPPLPEAAQGKELDAEMKEREQQSNKENLQPIRDRKTEEGSGQQGKAKEASVQLSKEAMEWADAVGRRMAKHASSCKETAFTTPEAKQKAAINIAKMKAGKIKASEGDDEGGEGMETTAGAKSEALKALGKRVSGVGGLGAAGALTGAPIGAVIGAAKAEKGERVRGALRGAAIGAGAGGVGNIAGTAAMKHLGTKGMRSAGRAALERNALMRAVRLSRASTKDLVGTAAAGTAGIVGGGVAGGKATQALLGKKKKAEAKAETVSRALNATAGAPEHIKQASAVLAARQVVELGKK